MFLVVGKECEYTRELCEYEYVYKEGFSFSCCLFFSSVYLTNLLAILALSSLCLVPPAFARPAFTHLQRSPVISIHSFSALACLRRSLVVDAHPSSAFNYFRLSPVPSACSSSVHSPPAFTRHRSSPVLGVQSFSALPVLTCLAFAQPRRSPVLGVHSFSAFARSQWLLIQCSPSPVLGVRWFLPLNNFRHWLIRHSLAPGTRPSWAFTLARHSECLHVQHSLLPGAGRSSAFTRSRQSSVLSVHSFSAIIRPWRSLVPGAR
jgi:hypothetical protein